MSQIPAKQSIHMALNMLWQPTLKSWLLASMLVLLASPAYGQISGTVYQDYNANGQRNTTSTINAQDGNPIPIAVDQGVGGVTVTAYDASGASVGTATTLANGTYTIAGVSGTVRIEFTNLPSNYYSGPIGSQNSTSIRFVTAPAANIDFGVNRFQDYSQDNPNYAFGLFAPLNRTTGTYASNAAVGILPSDAGSTVYLDGGSGTPAGYNQPALTSATLYSEVGTVWGLGWQRTTKSLYAGAFIKQFTDLGAAGTGAIYKIDLTNLSAPVTSLFADLNAIFGAGTSGANPFVPYPDFNIEADRVRVGTSVGQVALGDVDVSEDDKWLYVSNLKDHKIYSIPIDGSPVNSSTIVVSPKIPFPATYTDDQVISHAISVHNGKVYISATVPRYIDTVSLVAALNYTTYNYIYAYDPATNTFNTTPVLDYNFNGDPNTHKAVGLYISDFTFSPDGGMTVVFRYPAADATGGTSGTRILKACPSGTNTWEMEAWNGGLEWTLWWGGYCWAERQYIVYVQSSWRWLMVLPNAAS